MRILLTHTPSALENYYGQRALAALSEHGEVMLNPTGAVLDDPAALAAAAQGARVIVADRQTPGPATLYARLPGLLAFCRVAVDISTIDVSAASAHGVLVTRATPGFVPAVAELATGFMVDLARGVTGAAQAFRSGRKPDARMGRQLAGSTLGVIGYGAIGRRLAATGTALAMSVLVSDPHAADIAEPCRPVALDVLLAQSDFVVCLAAASAETTRLMGEAQFRAMRPGAYFLNLSRGQLVDEGALLRALDEGWIAGAALDVGMAPDQMPSPGLAAHPLVLATPHIGGLTPQAAEHQAFDTVRQVGEIAAGRIPAGAVNADAPGLRLRQG
jgi:D-3-phosphoglycerate dehydrogenase / 2-oxoglutarate reductase